MEIRGKRRKHGGDEDQARAGGRLQLLMLPMLPMLGAPGIEVASVIELSEASGRVAAGLFMTEG